MLLRALVPSVATALAVSVLAGACSTGGTVAPTPTFTTTERIEEIRAARMAVAEPAVALGEAVTTVALAVRDARIEVDEDPADRRETVAFIRDGALVTLDTATSDASDVELEGTSDDIEKARDAWTAAQQAAANLDDAARADLDLVVTLADAEDRLAEFVRVWRQPGSRSQQIERLGETADAADAVADDLEAVEERPACSDAVQRRVEAARYVAEASRELRSLVEGYRGNEFDERVEELTDDPYGQTVPFHRADAVEVTCWQDNSEVTAARDAVRSALDELQAALNPPDLESPGVG